MLKAKHHMILKITATIIERGWMDHWSTGHIIKVIQIYLRKKLSIFSQVDNINFTIVCNIQQWFHARWTIPSFACLMKQTPSKECTN